MGKYGCFRCPEIGHDSSRELHQKCPKCGYTYDFPLTAAPKQIGKYEIKESLNRGFYGAVYLVTDEVLGKDYVLKVIPKATYALHGKDFAKECREHAELARNSQYIVNINSAEEHKVLFSNSLEIDCHVAVMEYVEGDPLSKVLNGKVHVSSVEVAQIAIDLFRILSVLRNKQKNHNDLHPDNLIVQQLSSEDRRAGEIAERIRVVAIDIGSLTTENKAGDSPDRQGDVHWVAQYLIQLSERLIRDPDLVSDQDYRLASLIEDRAKLLYPAPESQRQPQFDEISESIRNCFNQQAHPWEEPLRLLNFNDTYNAQTLEPWFVPSLLVDPNEQWLHRISGKGPLVITGMRGCGKTMMLRSVEFHARAATAKIIHRNLPAQQLRVLRDEGFVGIYVSCNKLLDQIGKASTEPLHQPFSRLFIRYGIEAIKSLRHLKTIDESSVTHEYYLHFVELYRNHLSNSELLNTVTSELLLEQCLQRMSVSLNKGESKYVVEVNPANAFPALAEAIRKSAAVWANHNVLFLLDDVSTRYLGEKNITTLLSSLIFQSEECAFKITSEVQTIELLVYSPGKVEKAKKGRDFETFDLGAAVNEKIRNKGGKQFVLDILTRRAKSNPKHPNRTPLTLIGDATLNSIAQNIVTRGEDKTKRKKIYHGISALAGVCVGDIGDIINLYDRIIRNFDSQTLPIPADKQSEAFQDLCSIRLHEISKRGSQYKDFARSFAQASYELLMQSAKNKSGRLRQYYSIYVRITSGNMEFQYEKIRELLDAGIFVYSGSANTPRTAGNDTNPINQFKLTFRKLYGVSNLIGLTQGDRFELSGTQLEDWLNNPSKGKEILMKSIGGTSSNVDEGDDSFDEDLIHEGGANNQSGGAQTNIPFSGDSEDAQYSEDVRHLSRGKSPKCEKIDFTKLSEGSFDVLIAALGFEERTVESLRVLLDLNIKKILLIKYSEEGRAKDILQLVRDSGIGFEIIDYEKVKTSFEVPEGEVLCDITGMSKSMIFNVARNALRVNKSVWIAHTLAKTYYPLNEDIQKKLDEYAEQNNYSTLDVITENVLKGEAGPYEVYDLLFSDADESKRNILIGYATSKYERLFKVLEERTFDRAFVFTSSSKSNRARLGRLASEVISKSYQNVESIQVDSTDITENINLLTLQYQRFYIDQNFNFELALTGSKRQTVACAAISAAFKVSHCWYVKPSKWDTASFSSGVGEKAYFRVCLDKTNIEPKSDSEN